MIMLLKLQVVVADIEPPTFSNQSWYELERMTEYQELIPMVYHPLKNVHMNEVLLNWHSNMAMGVGGLVESTKMTWYTVVMRMEGILGEEGILSLVETTVVLRWIYRHHLRCQMLGAKVNKRKSYWLQWGVEKALPMQLLKSQGIDWETMMMFNTSCWIVDTPAANSSHSVCPSLIHIFMTCVHSLSSIVENCVYKKQHWTSTCLSIDIYHINAYSYLSSINQPLW